MINIFGVIILYGIVFIISELLYLKFNFSLLFSRKVAHILGSLVSLVLPYFVSSMTTVIIGVCFSIIIFISKKKKIFKCIHDKNRMSVGEIVFPLGISLSAFFIWPISIAAYQGSCLVLGLSDGIAGYIGEKYGKTKYNLLGGDKTIEGSSVFFLVTLFIFVLYYLFYTNIIFAFEILLIFMYVAFITFLESIFCRGWDNIIIPFVSGIILIFILS